MSEILHLLRSYLSGRTARERWLMTLGVCVMAAIAAYLWAIAPLQTRVVRVEQEIVKLDADAFRAQLIAREVRRLQAGLVEVEARIKPGERTNLFTLLEDLAAQASVQEQLESIKPKQPSGNEKYPETRAEVRLKGTTLDQAVQFLYKIETAPVHLIVRSLRIKARKDSSALLDISFSVSSFEHA